MIAFLALSLAVILSAESQRPAPRGGEIKRNPPSRPSQSNQREAAPDPRGTENAPVIVRILPVPKTQEQAAEEQRERQDQASFNRWAIRLSGFTLIVLIVQSFVLWRQNIIMKNQSTIMDGQASAAHQQVGQMKEGLVATREGAHQARRAVAIANKSLLIGQRAYIDISYDPPGLKIETFEVSGTDHPAPEQRVQLVLKIRNGGNTPARVTAVLVDFVFTEKPLAPIPVCDSRRIERMRRPIARDDHFIFPVTRDLEVAAMKRAQREPGWELYVIGYVDYIDRFQKRHRAGYGYRYTPFFVHEHAMYEHRDRTIVSVAPDDTNLTVIS
jgi:hypothetical protein